MNNKLPDLSSKYVSFTTTDNLKTYHFINPYFQYHGSRLFLVGTSSEKNGLSNWAGEHEIAVSWDSVVSYHTFTNPPLLIFQMGKVGSKSLQKTLSSTYQGDISHAHSFEYLPNKIRRLLSNKDNPYPLNIICPVREPISKNISTFFQNFNLHTQRNLNDNNLSILELRHLFLTKFPHQSPLEWFDKKFKDTFSFDIYQNEFLKKEKYSIYTNEFMRILIYRIDLDRTKQLSVISDFLGYEIKAWVYDNVSNEKGYGELYTKFCQDTVLPEYYLKLLGSSKYRTHFWTNEEFKEFSAQWK